MATGFAATVLTRGTITSVEAAQIGDAAHDKAHPYETKPELRRTIQEEDTKAGDSTGKGAGTRRLEYDRGILAL